MRKLGFVGVAFVASAIFNPAIAADMIVKAPVYQPAPTWSGFYLGLNGGYGVAKRTVSYAGDPLVTFDTCSGGLGGVPNCIPASSATLGGGFGGLQIGYNWQMRQWLFGLEADYDWANIRGSAVSVFTLNAAPAPLAASLHLTETIKSFGTVRARFGWLPNQDVLVYVTGGLAYGRAQETGRLDTVGGGEAIGFGSGYECPGGTCFVGSASRTAIGWTAGAGFEALLCNNLSIKAEYLYLNLGSGTTFTATALFSDAIRNSSVSGSVDRLDLHIARVGLNYRLGGS